MHPLLLVCRPSYERRFAMTLLPENFVLDAAIALESKRKRVVCSPTSYFNRPKRSRPSVEGKYFTIQLGMYFSFSLHDCRVAPAYADLSKAICAGEVPLGKSGLYWNRFGSEGLYATIRTSLGWCMIGIAPTKREAELARQRACSN